MAGMTLGELLELMHTSATRWKTLRATGTEWRDPKLNREAFMGAMHRLSTKVPVGEAPVEPPSVEPWRLWIRQPSSYRTVFTVDGEEVTAVVDGDRWWSLSPSRGARTNSGRQNYSHGLGPGEHLFRFDRSLASLHLEDWNESEFAQRSVVRVSARSAPREERTPYDEGDSWARSHLHGIGGGADAYELIVDSERGVLLRSEAHLEGKAFRILEVESIYFDETFGEETFRLNAPEGTSFQEA